MSNDGLVVMGKRIYLPNDEVLKGEVLKEAHESKLAIHLGSTKMYRDLKESYWWPKMKREIAEYVAKCAICQQVKVKHQRQAGELRTISSDSRMEMREYHYGFCIWVTKKQEKT